VHKIATCTKAEPSEPDAARCKYNVGAFCGCRRNRTSVRVGVAPGFQPEGGIRGCNYCRCRNVSTTCGLIAGQWPMMVPERTQDVCTAVNRAAATATASSVSDIRSGSLAPGRLGEGGLCPPVS